MRKYPAAYRFYLGNDFRDLRHDVKERRLVFLIRDHDGTLVDAVGRADDPQGKPKWKRYNNSSRPFVLGNSGSLGVVVEDAISGASVFSTKEYGAVALLGTSLYGNVREWAKLFKGLIVCLDYDASIKALEVTKRLSWYVPTVTCLLKKDLKWFDADAIKSQLETSRRVLNGTG